MCSSDLQDDAAAMADVDAFVEAPEVGGIERKHDHAGKVAVVIAQPAGQLNRPLARGAPQHRLADVEEILGARGDLVGQGRDAPAVELMRTR